MTKMSKQRGTLAILSCLLGFVFISPPDSSAFRPVGNTWGDREATMSLNLNVNDPVDQGGQTDPWNSSAEDALFRWTDVGSRFEFFLNNNNEDECDRFNFITPSNAVEWAGPTTCGGVFGPGQAAVTIKTDNPITGNVNNADVLFNRSFLWTTADPGFTTSGPINFNYVAMHEFGHVLGLGHEDRTLAVMNSIYHPNPHRLHADDRRGVRARYGRGRVETDIGPSNWKKTTSARVAADLVSSPASAVAGDTIAMEWTQENFGTTPASFNIAFLLSGDNIISPLEDILVGRNIGASQPAGSSSTFQRSVTIPADTPRGTFFLGVCLDDDNALLERFEENNCLAHPRTIVISPQPVIGDIDSDGDVDRDDLEILLQDRGKSVSESACGARCDLNGDGQITGLDVRELIELCSRTNCATQ
jgi:Matrixin/Dockerin type I domain/CARDB